MHVASVERPMVRLPCTHLHDRPTANVAVVACGACDRSFRLELDAGDRIWNAREET